MPGRGLGETACLLRRAMEVGGIPYRAIAYSGGGTEERIPDSGTDASGQPLYDTNLFCLDRDQMHRFARDVGPDFFDGRYNIGLWFCETEAFPDEQSSVFCFFDEVWVCSEFVHKTVSGATAVPVRYLPHPMELSGAGDRAMIDWLELGDRFVYLTVLDFVSDLRRKNPMAVIEAFEQAFSSSPDADRPLLVIKTVHGAARPRDLLILQNLARHRENVRIIDQRFESSEMAALMERADCYVSLHRSEALGRALMESMLRGKPCVATGYSGNLQFMDATNSFLCPHRMVAITKASYPHPVGTLWADPDSAEAARQMRKVHDDPSQAAAKGAQGRNTVREHFSLEATARVINQHLAEIGDRSSQVMGKDLPVATKKELAFKLLKRDVKKEKTGNFSPSGLFRLDFPQVLELFANYDKFQRKTHAAVLKALKESDETRREEVRGLEKEIESLTELVGSLVIELAESKKTLPEGPSKQE